MPRTQLADVTNLQQRFVFASPQYVEVNSHRRYFANFGQYVAALYDDARQWDEGKPEYQRNTTLNDWKGE